MHEMSLISSLLDMVQKEAERKGFNKVKAVWLRAGSLAAVEPEALSFCFDALSAGTILEGAKLELIPERGVAFCKKCNKEVSILRYGEPCPKCKSYGLKIISGASVFIDKIEVD